MSNTLNSQTIFDGERTAVLKYTGLVDTAETAVVKVDVSALSSHLDQACTGCKINRVWAQTGGCEVQLLWDATTDVFIMGIPANTNYENDFSLFGGIPNNAGAGKTGDILFTTTNVAAGDFYSVTLEIIKTYG